MFSIGLGLAICGVGLIIAAGLLVKYAKIPPWTHRDLLAFIALIATIGGAVILTVLKWDQTEHFNAQADRLISELVRERKDTLSDSVGEALKTIFDAMAWDHRLTSVGIIVVLLSLGLVISARTIKGKIFGNEFSMDTSGQGAAAAGAASAAEAATDRAAAIAEGAPVGEVDAAPR